MIDQLDKQKLFDGYLSSLGRAWDSYIKVIDILISLSGATALVFIASIKVGEWVALPNKHLIFYVFLFSGLALLSGVLWRFASQYFMEYETLGSSALAEYYFSASGITPVTKSHQSSSLRVFYRLCFRGLPIPTTLSLLASWFFVFLVFFGKQSQ